MGTPLHVQKTFQDSKAFYQDTLMVMFISEMKFQLSNGSTWLIYLQICKCTKKKERKTKNNQDTRIKFYSLQQNVLLF